MSGISTRAIIYIAIALTAMLFFFIIWKARRNSRIDVMPEEKPRRMWYQLGCKECGTSTPHAQITDGLCPECYAPVEAGANLAVQITDPMLSAGVEALRRGDQSETQTVAQMFSAMLKAMPIEQKRAIMRNLPAG